MGVNGQPAMGFGLDWSADHWLWALGMHAVFWIVLVVLIVGLVVAFGISRDARPRVAKDDAESVLNVRYARGEIDRAEYLDRKRDLRARPGRG